jgi:hypothetical protein
MSRAKSVVPKRGGGTQGQSKRINTHLLDENMSFEMSIQNKSPIKPMIPSFAEHIQ